MYEDIFDLFKIKPTVKTSEFIALGYSKPTVASLAQNGIIQKVGHGIYALPDTIVDDMYLLAQKSDKVVFSHESALFLNCIADRTPFEHSVTVKSDGCLSVKLREQCKVYYIQANLYEIGLSHKATTFGNSVKCYNPERTICDLLRSRNRIEQEIVVAAIKNYSGKKDKNLNLLAEYAGIFKVGKILKAYMEVLL